MRKFRQGLLSALALSGLFLSTQAYAEVSRGCTLYRRRPQSFIGYEISLGKTVRKIPNLRDVYVEWTTEPTNCGEEGCSGGGYYRQHMDDTVGRVVVTKGCRLSLYEHPNYGGGLGLYVEGDHDTTRGFGDHKASSAICDCTTFAGRTFDFDAVEE